MANNTINDTTALVDSNLSALNDLMAQLSSVNTMIQQLGTQVSTSATTIADSFSQMASSSETATQAMQTFAGAIGGCSSSIIETLSSYASFIADTSTAVKAVTSFCVAIGANTAAIQLGTKISALYSTCMRVLTVALGSTRLAAIALSASLTMGLSLAINLVIEGINMLKGKQEEQTKQQELLKKEQEASAKIQEKVREEQEKYTNIMVKSKSEMILLISELKNFKGSKAEESSKVEELNRKYSNTLGCYQSVAEWYKVLTDKSEDYCRSMVLEAKIRDAANKVATAEIKKDNTPKNKDGSYSFTYMQADEEARKAMKQLQTYSEEYNKIQTRLSNGKTAKKGAINSSHVPQRQTILDPTSIEASQKHLEDLLATQKRASESEAYKMKFDIDYGKSILEGRKFMAEFGDKTLEKKAEISVQLSKEPEDLAHDLFKKTVDDHENNEMMKVPKVDDLKINANVEPLNIYKLALDEAKKKQDELREGLGKFGSSLNDLGDTIGGNTGAWVDWSGGIINSLGILLGGKDSLGDYFNFISGSMSSLGKLVGNSAGQWIQWGASVMQAVGIAITQIMALIPVKKADATANVAQAATGSAASVASIPLVGYIMAGIAVASVLAALATIPGMANGGIAYGPTMAVFGEYSGAANNPEVVAPLNKLRALIQPADGGGAGRVEFKIQGRELVGLLHKMNTINSRVNG